jgi:hypothetical protein
MTSTVPELIGVLDDGMGNHTSLAASDFWV